MATVDKNRLKGNYGAAYVSARLSSECLVRPVAADTDVGVDLYCETIERHTPFLHFWVQVKAGAQCQVSKKGDSAKHRFRIEDLKYWFRQPVPVFAALVPVDWPVTEDPTVYIVDITSQLLSRGLPKAKTLSLGSTYRLRPHKRKDVQDFLSRAVPISAATLKCKYGIVAQLPQLRTTYEQHTPIIPVDRFGRKVLNQIRKTAAFSIIFLHSSGKLRKDPDFRQKLESVISQFGDDPHYETDQARAICRHAEKDFDRAAEFYLRAIDKIRNDPKVSYKKNWRAKIKEISALRERALGHKNP